MQTWKSGELIYPMVTKDYNLKSVKPVWIGRNVRRTETMQAFIDMEFDEIVGK